MSGTSGFCRKPGGADWPQWVPAAPSGILELATKDGTDDFMHALQAPIPLLSDGHDSPARMPASRSRASGKRRFPSAGASRDFKKWQVVFRPSLISAAVPLP